MLVNITFSLPDETVKKLREVAMGLRGSKKGTMSDLVDVAIREHLQEVESMRKHEEFRAMRGNQVVAKAASLRELASALERRGVDPREVLILSSLPLEPSVRTGLRQNSD